MWQYKAHFITWQEQDQWSTIKQSSLESDAMTPDSEPTLTVEEESSMEKTLRGDENAEVPNEIEPPLQQRSEATEGTMNNANQSHKGVEVRLSNGARRPLARYQDYITEE
jgi:hypothetical protein